MENDDRWVGWAILVMGAFLVWLLMTAEHNRGFIAFAFIGWLWLGCKFIDNSGKRRARKDGGGNDRSDAPKG